VTTVPEELSEAVTKAIADRGRHVIQDEQRLHTALLVLASRLVDAVDEHRNPTLFLIVVFLDEDTLRIDQTLHPTTSSESESTYHGGAGHESKYAVRSTRRGQVRSTTECVVRSTTKQVRSTQYVVRSTRAPRHAAIQLNRISNHLM
jgi:hypothetical protein